MNGQTLNDRTFAHPELLRPKRKATLGDSLVFMNRCTHLGQKNEQFVNGKLNHNCHLITTIVA